MTDRTRLFYEPTEYQLSRLGVPWICSYSGGKDSTSLVTWMEWLRRKGWITAPEPRLVLSDTGVEYPFLGQIAEDMMTALRACGWKCDVVRPETRLKLYCQIFGRGVPPVHPGMRGMRWCTRATKIDPMDKFRQETCPSGLLILTGVRWGESKQRDEKLLKGGCVAGGECGVPGLKDLKQGDKFGPIIEWSNCSVLDWLQGGVDKEVRETLSDLLPITRRLLTVYGVKKGAKGFGLVPPKVSMLRFGCVGCPAINRSKVTEGEIRKGNTPYKQLRRIYRMWDVLRLPKNRVWQIRKKKRFGNKEKKFYGPIRMPVRQQYFTELLDIQDKSGVCLVTEEDIKFIHKCWEDKVYPRGWSWEDEKRCYPDS